MNDLSAGAGPLDLLRVALHDASIARAQEAAQALSGQGPPSAEVLEALALGLKDERTTARRRAANLLGQFGPAAAPVSNALAEALRDPGWTVREAAARALGPIASGEGEERAALVRAALRDRNRLVRDSSARALARAGDPAPGLLEGLADPRARVRCRALRALAMAGGRPGASLATILAKSLRDPHRKVRRAAATALGELGGAAGPAMPDLIRRLHDGEPAVRDAVAAAMTRIEPALPERQRGWLATLAAPRLGPAANLRLTLERPDLPEPSRAEFLALCHRRALWHSRRARHSPSDDPPTALTPRKAAEVVLARAIGAAKPEDAPRAEVEEAAWLLAALAQMLWRT